MINDYTKARATNVTGVETLAPTPTTTEPTGDGVFEVPIGAKRLVAALFGRGVDNATFTFQITTWNRIGSLWVPRVVWRSLATLCGVTGVSGAPITDLDRFVDLVSGVPMLANGALDGSQVTGSEMVNHVYASTLGAAKAQFTFSLGTATGANAIFRWEE